jgi:hypothetical protein
MRRLTGSPAAGFCAAVLWLVNSSLILTMVWSSAYNQALCAFFLLSAFWFLVRYTGTGRRSDYIWQWAAFLAGFGALEVNVVYPALAAAYAFLCARQYFRATLPLLIPSIAFTLVDRMAAHAAASGVYELHFDRAMPMTFLTYWQWALASSYLPSSFYGRAQALLIGSITLALLAFGIVRAARRDWLPVFFAAWFGIVLAPFLPLRDHVSDYYLLVPTIGLAMLGAYALLHAWHSHLPWRLLTLALVTGYGMRMVRVDQAGAAWWSDRSLAVERMVLGVVRGHQLHSGKQILLDGVNGDLFWAGISHHPFRVFGFSNVYLTPGSEAIIDPHGDNPAVRNFVLPRGPTLHAAKSDRIVVYQVGPHRLRAITSTYEESAIARFTPEVPSRIDVQNPLMDYLLGPEWYPPENGSRWMPKRATLRIGAPRTASERLHLDGFLPAQLSKTPIYVTVTVDGAGLGQAELVLRGTTFSGSFLLPNEAVGREELHVSLEVERTFRPFSDSRELGLNFGTLEVR